MVESEGVPLNILSRLSKEIRLQEEQDVKRLFPVLIPGCMYFDCVTI